MESTSLEWCVGSGPRPHPDFNHPKRKRTISIREIHISDYFENKLSKILFLMREDGGVS